MLLRDPIMMRMLEFRLSSWQPTSRAVKRDTDAHEGLQDCGVHGQGRFCNRGSQRGI